MIDIWKASHSFLIFFSQESLKHDVLCFDNCSVIKLSAFRN